MSNDEVKKQAEQAARVKQNIVAVNNLNIPQQSQSHVLPVANTPSIGEQARRNEAATENREREKSAYTVEKNLWICGFSTSPTNTRRKKLY